MEFIAEFRQAVQKVIDQLQEELKALRTGRANAGLVENIPVETYSGSAKLKVLELSAITTEGPTTIVISPFDQTTSADIERAIRQSPLGLNPQTQGNKIIIHLPPLSEEQRDKYLRLVSQKVEEKRNIIRNLRDEIRKKIKLQFEQKTLTEDDKFRLEKEIDNVNTEISAKILKIKTAKEQEIREI